MPEQKPGVFATAFAVARVVPRECRGQAVLLLLAMLLNAAAEMVGVASVLPFVSAVSDPAATASHRWMSWLHRALGSPDQRSFLVITGFLFLGLFLLTNVVNAGTFWLTQRFNHRLRQHISSSLLARYLSRPYAWLIGHHSADLGRNVLEETDRLVDSVLARSADLLTSSVIALAISATLVWIEPVIALTTAVGLSLLYSLTYRYFRSRVKQLGARRVQANSLRHRIAHQAVTTVKEARAQPVGDYFLDAFRTQSDRHARLAMTARLIGSFPKYISETLAIAAIVGVFVSLVASGRSVSSLTPVASLFVMATWRLVPALQAIYASVVEIRFGLPLVEWITKEFSNPVDAAPTDGNISPLPLNRMIRVRDVSFAYPGGASLAIRGLSLEIRRGTSLGLVGVTGAGKTTVADLISGFLSPVEGSVEVDDVPLTRLNAQRWQRNVGYVPQDVFILDDSVRRNIALGIADDRIDQAAVRRAARMAHIDTFIEEKLPSGYDTVLGERGVSLSGGERQRIGLARALYTDPDVLILDEATSALDNITEHAVVTAIRELARRKTLIVIAHRLTTVQMCDVVCLMRGGEAIAIGPFDTLLATSPAMQELARAPVHAGPG